MTKKMKPSQKKAKLEKQLKALAVMRNRILDDVRAALEDLTTNACVSDVGTYGADPLESVEDAIDEVRDTLERLERLANDMTGVTIEQAQTEDKLDALAAAPRTKRKGSKS